MIICQDSRVPGALSSICTYTVTRFSVALYDFHLGLLFMTGGRAKGTFSATAELKRFPRHLPPSRWAGGPICRLQPLPNAARFFFWACPGMVERSQCGRGGLGLSSVVFPGSLGKARRKSACPVTEMVRGRSKAARLSRLFCCLSAIDSKIQDAVTKHLTKWRQYIGTMSGHNTEGRQLHRSAAFCLQILHGGAM